MFKGLFSKETFEKLKAGLEKTKSEFVGKVKTLFKISKIDESFWEELEEIMLISDVGVNTTARIIDDLRTISKKETILEAQPLYQRLKQEIVRILSEKDSQLKLNTSGPSIIFVVGVNGVGKTTSIAKLAHLLKSKGKRVMLSAADTFRAAATEQIDIWSKRIGVEIVKHKEGADPAAVVFDSINAALARQTEVIIVDTAGRLQTKVNLMEELKKIKRVAERQLGPGAVTEVLLVLDANTGQNAFIQAKIFLEAVNVTGIILTKLDGTAKGGIVIGITDGLNIPIKFIGIGEKIDDLKEFSPEDYVNAMFED
jgi:fused signal recognition particle receptor